MIEPIMREADGLTGVDFGERYPAPGDTLAEFEAAVIVLSRLRPTPALAGQTAYRTNYALVGQLRRKLRIELNAAKAKAK